MNCSIRVLQPACGVYTPSAVVRVHETSVMVNVPTWSQRTLNSHNMKIGDISAIVIEEATPRHVAGAVTFLKQLREYSTFAGKLIVPTIRDMEFLNNLNTFAGREMFEGELVVCEDTYRLDHALFALDVRNVGERLVASITPKIRQANFDRALLERYKLVKQHMVQLQKEGTTTAPDGTVLRIEELQTTTECPSIHLNTLPEQHGADSVFIRTMPSFNAPQTKVCVDLIEAERDYGHVIRGALDFYRQKTGTALSGECFEPQVFNVFPPKLFGLQKQSQANAEKIDGPLYQQPEDIENVPDYVQILGSSAMVPSKYANVASNLVSFRGELVLVDCGEGTLQQLMLSPTKPDLAQIKAILITHEHLDHYGGVACLYRHFKERHIPFPRVYGADAIRFFMRQQGVTDFDFTDVQTLLGGPVRIASTITCMALPIQHTQFSVSFLLVENGRCVFISGDGRPHDPGVIGSALREVGSPELCVAVHEATLLDQQDQATERFHSTIKELIAWDREVQPKRLIFTHLSTRYTGEWLLGFLSDAEQKRIFQGFDFMVMPLPPSE